MVLASGAARAQRGSRQPLVCVCRGGGQALARLCCSLCPCPWKSIVLTDWPLARCIQIASTVRSPHIVTTLPADIAAESRRHRVQREPPPPAASFPPDHVSRQHFVLRVVCAEQPRHLRRLPWAHRSGRRAVRPIGKRATRQCSSSVVLLLLFSGHPLITTHASSRSRSFVSTGPAYGHGHITDFPRHGACVTG